MEPAQIGLDLYRCLVQYQCQANLPDWLVHSKVREGKFVPKSGKSPEIGIGENKDIRGFLILANGDTLVDRLVEDRIVLDDTLPGWHQTPSNEEFIQYLDRQRGNDGAYVVDTKNMRSRRVREFNNNIKKLRAIKFGEKVPSDFLSQDGSVDPTEHMGLKSRNAIRTAAAYEGAESYQLKATPYNSSGLGSVCHFTKDGLKKMFFIELQKIQEYDDPISGKKYEKYQLMGVWRTYAQSDGKYVVDAESRSRLMEIYANKAGSIYTKLEGGRLAPFSRKTAMPNLEDRMAA